jgi:hypothetical protein
VSVFHLIERGEFLQELNRALNVLQHRRFACLGESIRFAHDHYRTFLSIFIEWVLGVHGRPLARQCPLDVSLGSLKNA